MPVNKKLWMVPAALVVAMGAVLAYGDAATVSKAREVFNKHKDCVVMVSATVKVEATGDGRNLGTQERKGRVLGTVIDPSGLTVVSLSAIDPAVQMQGRTVQGVKVSAKSEHSDIKINLADGTEVPARLVLKDEDLDLAFLAPEKKDDKLSALAVQAENAPEPKELDEIICLSRMDKSLGQAPEVATGEIGGIVRKPRLFYVGGRSLGGPVFTLEGKLLGITVAYKIESEGAVRMAAIILPAQDVKDVAKQALAKKDQPTTAPTTAPATMPG
jgi:hypothetical protein